MLWLFYPVSLMMLVFANMVILSNHPVRSVLSLIGCFLCATVLWLLAQAEFLGLALIFIYIGAVMTLFLFVVMMLNIEQYDKQDKLSTTLAIGVVLTTIGVPLAVASTYGGLALWLQGDWQAAWPENSTGISNVEQLGAVLYTEYVWPFEVVAMILLTAILVAVGLVMRKPGYGKKQVISEQLQANKADRIRLVDKKGEQS